VDIQICIKYGYILAVIIIINIANKPAAGAVALPARNFAAHCSNIERPDGGASARALGCGQSAQGRGVCAGTAQVWRSSPSTLATAAARERSSDWAAGDFTVSHRRPRA